MNKKVETQIVHVLAIVSGVLTILATALTQPPFNVPPMVPAIMGLVVVVLSYVSNQLPALGSGGEPPATVPTATEPAAKPPAG